ncbi:mitochondrial thiamine pyrophosphate transporter [Chytriomyces hyalinus]|nr:mitochondrial thiamine pyrophosphate transporter [Chytriomyces hyalinus]
MDKSVTASQNAVAGATAGIISRFVIAPLDVVKIRLQIQSSAKPILSASFRHNWPPPKYTGIFKSMAMIVREEGVKGLWKGNWPAEYLYLTYGAIQFLVYHEWHKSTAAGLFPETPKAFVGGALSGCIATFATYPLDLLRTRFAMQGTSRLYTSIYGACREILQTEGFAGFYRGMWPSILQIAPYMGIMFAVQGKLSETFKRVESPHWNHAWDQFTSGGVAGMLSKTAVMPFDVVR